MPHHLLSNLKRTTLIIATATMLAVTPASVSFAADTCSPPDPTTPGVHWPTGSDANAFTYQCEGDYAGEWLSPHYVFSPNYNTRTPLDPTVYVYNSDTDMFDAAIWNYNVAKRAYVQDIISVSNPPAGAEVQGNRPTLVDSNSGNSVDSATTPSASTQSAQQTTGLGGSSIDQSLNNGFTADNHTTLTAQNGIISFAGTGDASISNNTQAGGATSGSAVTIANVINMLQSSSDILSDPNMVTFTADINGDVNGDLLLDPNHLKTVQAANTATTLDNNVQINNSVDAAMINDISLDSQSGDASVSSNSKGGDATSGNADAVANIVNVLNSYVTAGQSFVGVININGNLNGDILLPPNFVDTLLANNVPHYNITTDLHNQSTVTNVNNATVQNNIQLAADTGDATVANNTSAGSAKTGSALTNLTVFNLTGSEIVASNDLLVFVNVLGQWYGMILNAPAGTTAASLGGGVTSNSTINNDATLTNTNNQSIKNNLNLKAKSGDASVTDNTEAGNATTGNATASANVMNLINDRLTLNGWFGLLFINVFGVWHGSFGIDTAAGDPVASPQSSGSSASSPTFAFRPTIADSSNSTSNGGSGSSSGLSADAPVAATTNAKVLAASAQKTTTDLPQLAQGGSASYMIPLIGSGLALLLVAFSERGRLHRRQ